MADARSFSAFPFFLLVLRHRRSNVQGPPLPFPLEEKTSSEDSCISTKKFIVKFPPTASFCPFHSEKRIFLLTDGSLIEGPGRLVLVLSFLLIGIELQSLSPPLPCNAPPLPQTRVLLFPPLNAHFLFLEVCTPRKRPPSPLFKEGVFHDLQVSNLSPPDRTPAMD